MYAVRWLAGASRASRLVLARPRSAPTAIARIDTENVHVRYVTLDLATSTYVDLLYRYRYRIGKINPSLSALSSLFPVVPLGIDRCHGTLNKLPR